MEGSPAGKENDHNLKHRLMGRLLGKDKKITTDNDVSEFLHGPSDKLHMATPSPTNPQLPRLDTKSASRWPTAAEIHNSRTPRGRSVSPHRSKKGLNVRFTDEQPEVIGEGGDEAEAPTSEISMRKRANSHPQSQKVQQLSIAGDRRKLQPAPGQGPGYTRGLEKTNPFLSGPLRPNQSAYESIPSGQGGSTQGSNFRPNGDPEGNSARSEYLTTNSHNSMSFAARVKAEMRAGEGRALTQAASNAFREMDSLSTEPSHQRPSSATSLSPQMDELCLNTSKNAYIETSPEAQPITKNSNSNSTNENTIPPSTSSTPGLFGAVIAVGDQALQDFSSRTRRLFTLFRIAAESVKPLSACSLEELVRAALWWFLKGRLNLEATIRDRPATPEAQRNNSFARRQAYADLAKALWIIEAVTPQNPDLLQQQNMEDINTNMADALESRQGIITCLRKLTMSMNRNNMLPPDTADEPLPQGLDNSIWVPDDGNILLAGSQKPSGIVNLSDAFPLGDSNRNFLYGRIFADATLREEDESHQYRCPVLVSIVRGQKEKVLAAVIASQNGTLKFCIQGDKTRGPTWEDVEWQPQSSKLNIKLPRGYRLGLQCTKQDYMTLWGTYDYYNKIHATLSRRLDEEITFENTLRMFQYFDPDLQSQAFPKEPLPHCQLKVFEKIVTEKAATRTRRMHRGFRIVLVTNAKTKNMRGINQDLLPNTPIRFDFLRGDGGFPALLVKIDDGKSKFSMVLCFDDVKERANLHERFTASNLAFEEVVLAKSPVKTFSMSSNLADSTEWKCLQSLDWQNLRVIDKDQGDLKGTKNGASDNLRVIMDFKSGTLTDRVNIGPGELKIRLEVKSSNELKVLRQPQQDMTISISDSQTSKDLPRELVELLGSISKSETSRTYVFPSLQELHLFQTALTGFNVVFDSTVASFNISRRRMVVSIYKKLDASATRVQVLQKEGAVQLVAFFEKFSHGDCMNLMLKGTDIFESSSRSGKFAMRIVDAKFAMPKVKGDGEAGFDNGFVCLDIPEYAAEHDDITILFDTEAERDSFAKVLPAPVKAASRMASVRR